MLELAAILKDFTPGAYGVWTGVLLFAAWLAKEWRETRKLSAEDREARREGYARQVESLQLENRALRADLAAAEQRHDEYRVACQRETDRLLTMVRDLSNEVLGLRRQITERSLSALDAIPQELIPPATAAAADRLRDMRERHDDDD